MELHCPKCQHLLEQDGTHAQCPSCGNDVELQACCPDCHLPLQVLKSLRRGRLFLPERTWVDFT